VIKKASAAQIRRCLLHPEKSARLLDFNVYFLYADNKYKTFERKKNNAIRNLHIHR